MEGREGEGRLKLGASVRRECEGGAGETGEEKHGFKI